MMRDDWAKAGLEISDLLGMRGSVQIQLIIYCGLFTIESIDFLTMSI